MCVSSDSFETGTIKDDLKPFHAEGMLWFLTRTMKRTEEVFDTKWRAIGLSDEVEDLLPDKGDGHAEGDHSRCATQPAAPSEEDVLPHSPRCRTSNPTTQQDY